MISPARHPGEIELHRQCFGEQAGVALRDARAAAGADLDLDDALRVERAQRVARDDPAHPEALGEVLFGAEKVARPHLLGEQRIAHVRHDLRRERGAAECDDVALAALDGRMKPHDGAGFNDDKDIIFCQSMRSMGVGRRRPSRRTRNAECRNAEWVAAIRNKESPGPRPEAFAPTPRRT